MIFDQWKSTIWWDGVVSIRIPGPNVWLDSYEDIVGLPPMHFNVPYVQIRSDYALSVVRT
jgi:hypothetical protein